MTTNVETKQCTACKETLELNQFGTRVVGGKTYPTTKCRKCFRVNQREKGWIKKESLDRRSQRRCEKLKSQRVAGNDVAYFIVKDSRSSDGKKKRQNDLTVEFVENLIADGCFYCGDKETRMTVDRIDNSLGHLQSNVRPACHRCNIARGTIPYEAWMYLTDGLRRAREAGAFGDWGSTPIARRKK